MISKKEFSQFMEIYSKKEFSSIKKFKTNKISKFIDFLKNYTGIYGVFKKENTYSDFEVYDMILKDYEVKTIEPKYFDRFCIIYHYQGVHNLRDLSFNQLLQYICFLRFYNKNTELESNSKMHSIEDIIVSLSVLHLKKL